MSRGVRGPTSALTEFLRERNITVANTNRFRRRNEAPAEDGVAPAAAAASASAEAGPSTASTPGPSTATPAKAAAKRRPLRKSGSSMNFDEEDDSGEELELEEDAEEKPASKRPRRGVAAASGSALPKTAMDEDIASGSSSSFNLSGADGNVSKKLNTPGSVDHCPQCLGRFSITQYTVMTPDGGLCHKCGKNADKAKKPAGTKAAPKKRQQRKVDLNPDHKELKTLQSFCIDIIADRIEDVDELIGVGGHNMDALCKSISKNRRLNNRTVQLFLEPTASSLRFYDCSAVESEALQSIATFSPNVEDINLQLCGNLDNAAIDKWCEKLSKLRRVELYGPFLVRSEAWHRFFEKYGEQLESFKIRETPRFNLGCCEALVNHCGASLRELGLAQIGPLDGKCLETLHALTNLTYLDISDPGVSAPGVPPRSLEDDDVIELLKHVGANLETLIVSGNAALTSRTLLEGILPHCPSLTHLGLSDLSQDDKLLTSDHLVSFFHGLQQNGAAPLATLRIQRCLTFDGRALDALLTHSGQALTELDVNSCDALTGEGISSLGSRAPNLIKLDVGFCRKVDDYLIKGLIDENAQGSKSLKEVWIFGCNKTTRFLSSSHVRIFGKERSA